MQIIYCDFCSLPIKGNNYFVLSIFNAKDYNYTTEEEYLDIRDKLQKEIKHICPTCKELINEIFKLRLQNINQISLELLGIYELSPKDKNNENRK